MSLMPKPIKLLASADDAEQAFYDAIGRADLEALMALWADDEEIACIHPGAPRLQGHAAIRESWAMIFERGPVHIRPRHRHVTHNTMCAVHSVVEEVRVPPDTSARQEAHILATNVYLKTPHGWRIVLHHASIAPGKPIDEQGTTGTLH